MSAQRNIENHLMSESEYFASLEKIDSRMEWMNGEVRLMAGGSPNHATLFQRFATSINKRLSDDSVCEARTADVKVRVEAANANYFPDVVVYCEDADFDANRPDWLLTPLLMAEVLSSSTEEIDENEKLVAYRSIPTLRHYLIISQRRVLIKHHHRNDTGDWLLDLYNWREQEIYIDFLDVRIPVEEIYRRLNIPEGMIVVSETNEEIAE